MLADNYEQNVALASAVLQAPALMHVHEDWMQRLERQGLLDRELEFLPSTEEVAERIERRQGLTAPELSVLMSYTKIVLADDIVDTDLPDDPFLLEDLHEYFPSIMREKYQEQIENHPLRRQIITTQVVNFLVNGAGITFHHRLSEETAASAVELIRANFVAREIFGSRPFVDRVYALDNTIEAQVQLRMRIEMRTLVERASRWLVNNRRPPLDSRATVDFFRDDATAVLYSLPEVLTGLEKQAFEERRRALLAQGVAEDLAERVAVLPPAYAVLTIVETATRDDLDPVEVARLHFALGERLELSRLVARILTLPRDDRWQTMARAALRDDLHTVHGTLTAQVLATTSSEHVGRRAHRAVGGAGRGHGQPRRGDAARDLRRRQGRPGADVGGSPSGADPAGLGRLAWGRTSDISGPGGQDARARRPAPPFPTARRGAGTECSRARTTSGTTAPAAPAAATGAAGAAPPHAGRPRGAGRGADRTEPGASSTPPATSGC